MSGAYYHQNEMILIWNGGVDVVFLTRWFRWKGAFARSNLEGQHPLAWVCKQQSKTSFQTSRPWNLSTLSKFLILRLPVCVDVDGWWLANNSFPVSRMLLSDNLHHTVQHMCCIAIAESQGDTTFYLLSLGLSCRRITVYTL